MFGILQNIIRHSEQIYQQQHLFLFAENFDDSSKSTVHMSLQDPEQQREISDASKICESEERVASLYHKRDTTLDSTQTSFSGQATNRPLHEGGERNNL